MKRKPKPSNSAAAGITAYTAWIIARDREKWLNEAFTARNNAAITAGESHFEFAGQRFLALDWPEGEKVDGTD